MLRVIILAVSASLAYGMTDLVATTAANENLTTLSGYIQQANMATTLQGQGPFTFLAPVDSAFANIPQADLTKLLSGNGSLSQLLKYHTVQGELFSYQMANGLILTTLSGHIIRVYVKGTDIFFNNAKAIKIDVEADNGVIYFLDTVLDVPEGSIYHVISKPENNVTVFKAAVDRVRYSTLLDRIYTQSSNYRYTVFVPSDAAFAKLDQSHVQQILHNPTYASMLVRYHIHHGTIHLKSLDHSGRLTTLYNGHDIGIDISNNDIRLNHIAHLTRSDIEAENGVVHMIDHVLIPSTLSGQIIG